MENFKFFVLVGVDPIEQTVIIANCGMDMDDFDIEGLDCTYKGVFDLAKTEGILQLHRWLIGCGMVRSEAIKCIQNLGRTMKDAFPAGD